MFTEKEILIQIRFAADNTVCECIVNEKASLKETAEFLREAMQEYYGITLNRNDEEWFMEMETGLFADPDASFGTLGIEDGTNFIVF